MVDVFQNYDRSQRLWMEWGLWAPTSLPDLPGDCPPRLGVADICRALSLHKTLLTNHRNTPRRHLTSPLATNSCHILHKPTLTRHPPPQFVTFTVIAHNLHTWTSWYSWCSVFSKLNRRPASSHEGPRVYSGRVHEMLMLLPLLWGVIDYVAASASVASQLSHSSRPPPPYMSLHCSQEGHSITLKKNRAATNS